jgi:hypothetical protein
MCFNAEVSIILFSMGILAAIKQFIMGYKNKSGFCEISENGWITIHKGLFTIAIVTMQLLEYFMWIDQDCKSNYNVGATKATPWLLWLQPTIFFGAALAMKLVKYNEMKTKIIFGLIVISYIIFTAFIIYFYKDLYNKTDEEICSEKTECCGRLEWPFFTDSMNENSIMFIFMFIFYIFVLFGTDFLMVHNKQYIKTRIFPFNKIPLSNIAFIFILSILIAIIYSAIVTNQYDNENPQYDPITGELIKSEIEPVSIYGSTWCVLCALIIIMV